jgi:hypothetical protein
MSGRGLANAVVFVLGLILVGGGAWGIVRGSQYIQIEQGWSSVISGSVAVTGGVLTLGVGFVLRRLDALYRVLLNLGTGAEAAPPKRAELGDAERVYELPIEAQPVLADGRERQAAVAEPALSTATAVNEEALADDYRLEHSAQPAVRPAALLPEAEDPFPPEVIHNTPQESSDEIPRAAGVSDEPELDAAIEQLLAEERARSDLPPQDTNPAERPPSINLSEKSHPSAAAGNSGKAPEAAAGRGSSWRGLFSRKDRGLAVSSTSNDAQIEQPFQAEPDAGTSVPQGEPPARETAPDRAIEHADPIPRTGDDWFDRALSGLDEGGPARGRSQPPQGDFGKVDYAQEISGSRLEIHPRSAEGTSRDAPVPANPAVIGQYTSGNTTYVMYADGSIEAETPTGILRFASLADLKVYVEGGQ